MEHAADAGWQAVETVVFATRAVATEAKPRIRGLARVSAGAAGTHAVSGTVAELRAELEATESFLVSLFSA